MNIQKKSMAYTQGPQGPRAHDMRTLGTFLKIWARNYNQDSTCRRHWWVQSAGHESNLAESITWQTWYPPKWESSSEGRRWSIVTKKKLSRFQGLHTTLQSARTSSTMAEAYDAIRRATNCNGHSWWSILCKLVSKKPHPQKMFTRILKSHVTKSSDLFMISSRASPPSKLYK